MGTVFSTKSSKKTKKPIGKKAINISKINLTTTLDSFLINENNYYLFVTYLEEHMAMESLLFIQNALIYRKLLQTLTNIITNKKQHSTKPNESQSLENSLDIEMKDDTPLPPTSNTLILTPTISFDDFCKSIKKEKEYINFKTDFKYLKNIINKMENKLGINKIKKMKKISQKMNLKIRNKVELLFNEIYNTYISENAKLAVNISFEVSMALDYIAMDLNKNKDISEYVTVFDNAIQEIWKLLSQIYIFNFQTFVQDFVNKKN